MKHNQRKLGFYIGLFFILISVWSTVNTYYDLKKYEKQYTARVKGVVTGFASLGRYNVYTVWWEDSTGKQRCVSNNLNIGIYKQGDYLAIRYNPNKPWEAVIDVPQETTGRFLPLVLFSTLMTIITFIAWPRNKYKDRIISFLRLPPKRFYDPEEL